MSRYETMSSESKFEGKIFSVSVDLVKMPDGTIHERELVKHFGAVGIIPLTEENEVVLVRQYRHPAGDELLEIPAGKLDAEEDPLDCALRELKEETGATGELIKLAEFYTTPGYSNEFFYLYLATDLKDGPADPEDGEILELVRIPLFQALEMISTGKINDGKTIAGLCLAERHLRRLKTED